MNKSIIFDKRGKKEIIQQIKKLADSYTPEWNFSPDNPDPGTAFALIFADLFEETINRFNQLPLKNFIAFLNNMDISLLPYVPAKGYISYMINSSANGGVKVPAGSRVYTSIGDQEGSAVYTTTDDVYVTPSKICSIYQVNWAKDIIIQLFDTEKVINTEKSHMEFFNFSKGKNEQSHFFLIANRCIFGSREKITFEICFEGSPYTSTHYELLADPGVSLWMYLTKEGWKEFDGMKYTQGKLLLDKDNRDEPELFEQNGEKNYFILCKALDIHGLKGIETSNIHIKSTLSAITPDFVFSNDIAQDLKGFYPFFERFSLYNDFYIASNEIFSKKNSLVTLSFSMHFEKANMDNYSIEKDINWKLIMKKSTFRKEEEYEAHVDRVIWEYWNGRGWKRILISEDYDTVFSNPTRDFAKIEFICPEDMQPIVINGCESLYIKVRIIRAENLYKPKGYFITPFIEDISLSYVYTGKGLAAEKIMAWGNMCEKELRQNNRGMLVPFEPFDYAKNAVYMSFDAPITGSPIKMYISVENNRETKPPVLEWEYATSMGDEIVWRSLNVVDGTDDLKNNGIVTFSAPPDMKKIKLFQKEHFFIRISDCFDKYDKNEKKYPVVKGIYLNSTGIIQKDNMEEEIFSLSVQSKEKKVTLSYGRIIDCDVWVNELGGISDIQMNKLLEIPQNVQIIKDSDGNISAFWVKWQESGDFLLSDPDDRHYIIDRHEGEVFFGNGKNGRVPPGNKSNNIKINYSCGGGKAGNVDIGAINRMAASPGFINGVINFEPTSGGMDRESVPQAAERGKGILKHRFRAVSAGDYEQLAREAARDILKVKCFANANINGNQQVGCITLVALPDNFLKGNNVFKQMKDNISRYLSDKIPETLSIGGKLNIIPPQYIELSLRLEIITKDFNQIFKIQNEVQIKLKKFFDPVAGNFNGQGWEIGQIPDREQIYNYLKSIKNIIYIKSIFISCYLFTADGKEEIDYTIAKKLPFSISVNGSHDILIYVE